MSAVRQRNESAWLLSPDGGNLAPGLRENMRTFRDQDEVDLVIVGCGAGG
ncbi:MAG: hypothetical protein JSS74_11225, partial [Actinobacteria bacterium]|nr:hypothetical protein [Actinomycetota bacterium]